MQHTAPDIQLRTHQQLPYKKLASQTTVMVNKK